MTDTFLVSLAWGLWLVLVIAVWMGVVCHEDD